MKKEFNLKEKQEKLFNEFIDAHPEFDYNSCRLFFSMIQDLRKEAVRKLKEKCGKEIDKKHLENSIKEGNLSEALLTKNINYANECILEEIDKIFGEELTKDVRRK